MVTKKLTKVDPKQVAWRFAELAKPLHNRGPEAKYLGDEPHYPSAEVQAGWTAEEYRIRLGRALNWYNYTQDNKKSAEWLYQFLARNPRRHELAEAVRKGDYGPGLLQVLHCGPLV